jgi:hypothetical protein
MTQGLPRVTQFLEAVLQELPDWRQSLNPFPVLSWPAFIAYLHQAVNPLAGDEHLKASLLSNFFHFIRPSVSLSSSYIKSFRLRRALGVNSCPHRER